MFISHEETDSQMNTEIYDFVMNAQTAHTHVCFCQCPFPPENLRTNSCFSHPPDAEHSKRIKARRAGWSLEKNAQNIWVLWGSVMLCLCYFYKIEQCIEGTQCMGEFCMVTLRDLSELMKLNLLIAEMSKWILTGPGSFSPEKVPRWEMQTERWFENAF